MKRSEVISLQRARGQQVWHQNALFTPSFLVSRGYVQPADNWNVFSLSWLLPLCPVSNVDIDFDFCPCRFTERALCETSGALFGFLTALAWVCLRTLMFHIELVKMEHGTRREKEWMNERKKEREKEKRRKYSYLFWYDIWYDIDLLQLCFHPVAVVVRLVQK